VLAKAGEGDHGIERLLLEFNPDEIFQRRQLNIGDSVLEVE